MLRLIPLKSTSLVMGIDPLPTSIASLFAKCSFATDRREAALSRLTRLFHEKAPIPFADTQERLLHQARGPLHPSFLLPQIEKLSWSGTFVVDISVEGKEGPSQHAWSVLKQSPLQAYVFDPTTGLLYMSSDFLVRFADYAYLRAKYTSGHYTMNDDAPSSLTLTQIMPSQQMRPPVMVSFDEARGVLPSSLDR